MKLLFVTIGLFLAYTLQAQTISQENLNELLLKAEATNSEAVLISQNGKLITENYFAAGHPDKKIEAMSATKSIVGLAVACMLTDGLIDSLDTPVYHFYPEWNQGRKKWITIRHLVHMTSGLQNHPNAGEEIYPSPDFVQLALAAELTDTPGEVWAYNNKSLNLMAGVVQKITGKRMDMYIGDRLFYPLGITDFTWSLDDAGNPHVMSGCQIKAKDFIKIGELLLNNGTYNNTKIIKPEHIAEVVTPCPQFPAYGMLWWIDYEENLSKVDDEIIESLQKAGIDDDFVQKMKKMKGTYATNEAFTAKLKEVFGENYYEVIYNALQGKHRTRKREFKGEVTYRADGYLGNYMIVDPKTKIVAVRMTSYDSFKDQKDNFPEFKTMANKLIE
jgi:CubicO group peptidase (beta-lactamase class C family)